MSLISRMRKQDAVYWPLGTMNEFGKSAIGSPMGIKCRWTDDVKQVTDANGVTRTQHARVYVDRDVVLGGYLWLGLLASAPADPKVSAVAYEIREFAKTPNFKATEFLRKAMV